MLWVRYATIKYIIKTEWQKGIITFVKDATHIFDSIIAYNELEYEFLKCDYVRN